MKNNFLLGFVLIGVLAMPAYAASHADQELVRSISVQGMCRKELVPDTAQLNMVALATNPRDLKAAVNEAVKIYEATRASLQKLKLKNAQFVTSEYNVQPIYDWNNGKQTLRGYQARIGLRVDSEDIDRMGDVMAVAAENNMKEVGQWQLVISPAQFQNASQNCLADAVVDARRNAEKMIAAAGGKLGKVLTLTQQGAFQPPIYQPMVRMMKAETATADNVVSPSIDAGKQDINVTVQASFEIE